MACIQEGISCGVPARGYLAAGFEELRFSRARLEASVAQLHELDIMGRWDNGAAKPTAVQWVKALRDDLRPFASGAYVNQLGETSEELVRLAYGANYARLRAVKKKYDPANVLRSNQNVRPA